MTTVTYSRLIIHMSRSYGSLNRLIGIVRQRGFDIETMHLESENETEFRIEMVIFSERQPVHLVKKISQMTDVSSVSLTAAEKGAPATT